MKVLPVLFSFLLPFAGFGQDTTEIRFVSSEQAPVFRISSLVVENSGLSLSSDVTEVMKKMELMTIAPSIVTVPNGDYLLNWGGTEEFNRTFVLHAGGSPLEVRLTGNRTVALWSLGAAGSGLMGVLLSAPSAWGSASNPLAVIVGSAVVAVGGLVGLLVYAPRVEVIPNLTPGQQ